LGVVERNLKSTTTSIIETQREIILISVSKITHTFQNSNNYYHKIISNFFYITNNTLNFV